LLTAVKYSPTQTKQTRKKASCHSRTSAKPVIAVLFSFFVVVLFAVKQMNQTLKTAGTASKVLPIFTE
jgi:hypothetical protein